MYLFQRSSFFVIPLLGAFLSATLVGCGGSGGGSGGGQTISGLLIDGYITDAKVCLDTNANLKCDDAISAKSTAGGKYSLDIPSGTDLSKYHVVVDVEEGVASDTDDPEGTKVAMGYTLLSPATKAMVVTPLTTFVSHQMMQSSSLTPDEAIAQAKKVLDIDDKTDLSNDYVKSADKKTHAIARVAAAVLAQTKTDVQGLVDAKNAALQTQALRRSLEEATPIIKSFSADLAKDPSQVDAVKANAITKAKTKVIADKDAIKKDVENEVEIGASTTIRFAELIKSEALYSVIANQVNESDSKKLWVGKVSSPSSGKLTYIEYQAAAKDVGWSDSRVSGILCKRGEC